MLVVSCRNRQSTFSQLTPYLSLPRYFDSEWSYAQYRVPSQKQHMALSAATTSGGKLSDVVQDERCTVAWIAVPPPPTEPAPPTSPTIGSRRAFDKGKKPEVALQPEYQMIALTYSGGWYRIALPASPSATAATAASAAGSSAGTSIARSPSLSAGGVSHRPSHHRVRSSSGSSIVTRRTAVPRSNKGKGKESDEKDKEKEKAGSECALLEFRRFGRWDGWG